MSSYNPLVPTGLVNLDTDYKNLQNNFQQADTSFGLDHYAFSDQTANNGYHKIIHQPPQTIDPAPIISINQIYAKNYTPDSSTGIQDTQLFTMTGLGGISQLTGNFIGNDGWAWIGGILIQWGRVAAVLSSTTSGTVTFKNRAANTGIPFLNNCFVVNILPYYQTTSPGAQATISVDLNTLTKLKFDWSATTSSSNFKGFLWQAIGN